MPTLTVEGFGSYDVPAGKKLVLAIEDAGIDIPHRCGGVPACTTCRVQIVSGDVSPISDAEIEALEEPELIETCRLSCQVRVDSDLTVKLVERVSTSGYNGAGDRPED